MLAVIVPLVIVGMLIFLGYAIGDIHARNQFFEEKKEILKEKDWWIDKFNECSEDLQSAKKKIKGLSEQIAILVKDNELLMEQNNTYLTKYGEIKQTIAMMNQEEIIELFNQGLSHRQIAQRIGCGASTIQRAIKKRGLIR